VADDVVIPIVAECDDSYLNDCRRMQVSADDVRAARDGALAARGSAAPPDEGGVGAGTGMSCYDFKGGIGTASRVTDTGHTVGVLLLTNFGSRDQLVVAGVPVGRLLGEPEGALRSDLPRPPEGSCIGVAVTDAAVDGATCERLARRVGLGLARTGSVAHNGSGEIFLGFGTGMRHDHDGRPDRGDLVAGPDLNDLFAAVVEAAEEAVLNSMFAAAAMVGRDGNRNDSLHSPEVLALLAGVRS
jgi:D-aminopeptidase